MAYWSWKQNTAVPSSRRFLLLSSSSPVYDANNSSKDVIRVWHRHIVSRCDRSSRLSVNQSIIKLGPIWSVSAADDYVLLLSAITNHTYNVDQRQRMELRFQRVIRFSQPKSARLSVTRLSSLVCSRTVYCFQSTRDGHS